MTLSRRGARRPSALAITALVMAVALVASLAVLGWAIGGTDWTSRRAADRSVNQALASWSGQPPTQPAAESGQVVAVLSSSRLGITWPVLAGVDDDQLDQGLGWYPQTSRPGVAGNMAVAGRRITHGSPFRKLLDLRPGDEITVRDVTGVFVYRVKAAPATVDAGPGGAWVLDPVPGADHAPATAVLTLTTAADLVATTSRAVVFAELVGEQRR